MRNTKLYFCFSVLLSVSMPCAAGEIFSQLPESTGTQVAIPSVSAVELALSPKQKKRADMLISIFENSTTVLQYSYIEDLHDGRGYTAGRAGFCSGCGDLLLVVERYTKEKPSNPLAKYLPQLRKLAQLSSASVDGLTGFQAAWEHASKDQLLRRAQDIISDKLYYLPALKYAQQVGLKKDFSKIALYEAAIQHGTGDDPDGLPAMINRASAIAKTPALSGKEETWLKEFLKIRRATLSNSSDQKTRQAWLESVGRADAMLMLFSSGNMDFTGPITLNPYGQTLLIP